jgi:iron complex transport system permease protein
MLLACALGAVSIPPLDIIRMTLDKAPFLDFEPTWALTDETIIFEIRLVRVVAGALVGAALATAGVLFQGLLRNPMADPYIIGTSAGAALGATLAMLVPVGIAFAGFGLVTVAAFCGALAAVLLVYNLASVGGRTPVVAMLLAGFVVSAMLVAVMSLLITVNDTLQVKLHSIFSFLMGSLSVNGWTQIAAVAPLVVGGIVVSRLFSFHLNAFSLGEEGAAFVGVNVEREKVLILALGSLLTACAVSLSGVVGFVGLVVPHAMRLALGPDHRLLLPASALGGAAFLVVADTVARTVLAPTEIPVGIFTALVGAPFFIYLLRRTRREYAF